MGLKELAFAVELPPAMKKQIGLAAYALLFAGKCNHTNSSHYTWESLSTMERATGLSRQGVVDGNNTLIDAGLIRRVDYKDNPGQRTVTYEINIHGEYISDPRIVKRAYYRWPDENVDNSKSIGKPVDRDSQESLPGESTELTDIVKPVDPTHNNTKPSPKRSFNHLSKQGAKSPVQKSPTRKSKPGGSEGGQKVRPEDVWSKDSGRIAGALCEGAWRVPGTKGYKIAEEWMGLILTLPAQIKAGEITFATVIDTALEARERSKPTEPEKTRIENPGAWFSSEIDRLRAANKRGDVAATGTEGPRRALEAFRQGTADGADTEAAG